MLSTRLATTLTKLQGIRGVRHKCLDCPDWDYCSECIKNASYIHPKHRFVPIYDPLPAALAIDATHNGVHCDGPLCKEQGRLADIRGIRYKCAVCHDIDFCASCEATPGNSHNRTHPLIKFKTPVKGVSITTLGDANGVPMPVLGDRPSRRSTAATTTSAAASANASTQVQATSEDKTTEQAAKKPATEKIEIKDLLAEPIQEKTVGNELPTPLQPTSNESSPVKAAEHAPCSGVPWANKSVAKECNALFVYDTVPDGTKKFPGTRFTQTWVMHNPGPHPWPVGCSVRYVGGDSTLDIDYYNPSSATEMTRATHSNFTPDVVDVGQKFAFRIQMKAPERVGRAISYWRLKAPDGTPFGHRLWCDIHVAHLDLNWGPPSDLVPGPMRPVSSFSEFVKQYNQQHAMAGEEQKEATSESSAGGVQTALHDYQAQLMLLERRNKATIKRVRDEQDQIEQRLKQHMKTTILEPLVPSLPAMDTHAVAITAEGIAKATGKLPTWSDPVTARWAGKQKLDLDRDHKDRVMRLAKYGLLKPDSWREYAHGDSLVNALADVAKEAETLRRSETAEMLRRSETAEMLSESKLESEPVPDSKLESKAVAEPVSAPAEPDPAAKEAAAEAKPEASAMIFPQLDKESPVASTSASTTTVAAPVPAPVAESLRSSDDDNDDLFVDAESVDLVDSASGEDGSFLTDEEYDILDASDEELV